VEVLDPAAPADTPVRAEGLPLQRARIVPFIVDPGGPLTADEIAEAIDPVWLACVLPPTQGLFGCLSAALPLELDGLVDCPGVDPAALDLTEIPRAPSPCRITQGSAAAPELGIFLDASFLLGGDIEATMIGHHPGEGSTAQCAAALLSGANPLPDACLYAVARVPVGPKGELLRLAAELGVPTDGLPPIPEPIPEPDTHPRIRSFTVRVFDQDAQVDRIEIEPGDTLRAPAGARLEIETEASEDDLQTYVIPVDSTEYAERDETFRGRWFRTWGTLPKLLGEGGMGTVELANDQDIARQVALKRIRPEIAGGAGLARFVDEVRIVGSSSTRTSCRSTTSASTSGAGYFFVMKYVEGETLESVIEALAAGIRRPTGSSPSRRSRDHHGAPARARSTRTTAASSTAT
jgi:hypothetical protein